MGGFAVLEVIEKAKEGRLKLLGPLRTESPILGNNFCFKPQDGVFDGQGHGRFPWIGQGLILAYEVEFLMVKSPNHVYNKPLYTINKLYLLAQLENPRKKKVELIFATIFGALVGSFLNVVILRLPEEGESIVFPPSHCPSCQALIGWYDNIPLISFFLLRGRCRSCQKPISLQYPTVELIMALLSFALFHHFGLSAAFFVYFVFCAALLAIIFIDLHHQIIPDVISLPGIILGFAASFLLPDLTWQDSALGVLFGGGIFYAIAAGYYLLARRAGMGGGDIKLLAMIGAFLGWRSLPFVIFASALLGSVIGIGAMIKQKKGGKSVIPYGPFLAVASYLYLFFADEIWLLADRYYLQ